MQYYGINEKGQSVYVAMSEKEVINYAKKHPEEGIIRVEDKFKHGYNLKESYIITESLKKWDKKEFEDNSNTYELEMLYESVKNTLSAQQKNDLAKFVRKAKSADEVNTYLTGLINKDDKKEESYKHHLTEGRRTDSLSLLKKLVNKSHVIQGWDKVDPDTISIYMDGSLERVGNEIVSLYKSAGIDLSSNKETSLSYEEIKEKYKQEISDIERLFAEGEIDEDDYEYQIECAEEDYEYQLEELNYVGNNDGLSYTYKQDKSVEVDISICQAYDDEEWQHPKTLEIIPPGPVPGEWWITIMDCYL